MITVVIIFHCIALKIERVYSCSKISPLLSWRLEDDEQVQNGGPGLNVGYRHVEGAGGHVLT